MQGSWRRSGPIAGGIVLLLALAGGLLLPGRFLATRDVVQFHLPLRATFERLLVHGLPGWNGWISGGQPILSDPSYAAFYPLTWLLLPFPDSWAISLFAIVHLAVALAGAWCLLIRLGCRPIAAAFGSTAFVSGGVLVSFASALNLLSGAAWLPWILVGADAVCRAQPRRTLRPAMGLATAFAMAALNGEPLTALCSGLAACAFALARPRIAAGRAVGLIVAAAILGGVIAAVQLLPALGRLAGSDRADGLSFAQAATWSTPPARAGELLFPRLLGDPGRAEEGLWFGWDVHDQDYPFLPAVYPGLAVLLLALAGLAARPIPYRGAWLLMAGGGALLALGRHTPLYALLHRWVPPFDGLRYPEKFLLLVAAALAFAAALTLERLLAEREAGRRGEVDLPLALAGVTALLAGGAAFATHAAPAPITAWVTAHSGVVPGPQQLARALAFYRGETLAVLGVALATLALFALLRRAGPAGGLLAGALLLLVAGDLVARHRGLLPTLPVEVLAPPAIVQQLSGVEARIFASATFDRRPDLTPLAGNPLRNRIENQLARLEPWTATLWDVPYALTGDFAVTFTQPLRRAVDAARRLGSREQSEAFLRLLGAWGAAHSVVRTDPERIARALAEGAPVPPAATLRTNPYALPLVRYLGAAVGFATPAAALDAALGEGLPLHEREFVIADWRGERRFQRRHQLAGFVDRGDRIEIGLEPGGETLLVVANTFDRDWRATADGEPVELLETAAGYQALVVPAGATRVVLEYRDPRVLVGAGISLAGLLIAGLLLRRTPAH